MERTTTFRNIFGFFIGPRVLPILLVTAMVALAGDAFAGANTSLPFNDDFEAYTNGTPLNTGTNGWYGSSSNIIVQMNTVRSGTNAAIIPEDCTLSNRFQDIVVTNVWIQMDTRPSLYDGASNPVVNTNKAVMFYINTNGNFVVHNGTTADPTNSVNWVVAANNVTIATNAPTWVRINIYENFAQTNWDLYADGVLVTNNIGFVNPTRTNFSGFDLYNDGSTSYLDNVSVSAIATNEATQRPLIVIPPTPSVRNVYVSETPSVQTAKVCNVWPNDINFEVTADMGWVSASPANGTVSAGKTTDVTFTYARTLGWQTGISNAAVTFVAVNGSARWSTQTVDVVLNMTGYGSGTLNTIPFYDDFENYANLTPLIGGIHGWYGTSTGIVVQQSVVRGGLQAAMIPVNCTLSNRFVSTTPTNVWIQMDARPSLFSSTTNPVVDTNQVVMFYINTNGNFVVHNGTTADPTNSANWVVTTNSGIGTNGTTWVRINIYENFVQTNWNLYANGILVTNNIGFINPTMTNFSGFDIDNGAATSYLDNVSVLTIATNEATQLPLIVIPPTPAIINLFVGTTPSVQTAKVCNVWPNDIGFEVTTDKGWVSAAPANTNVVAGTTQDVTLTYTEISGWPAGTTSNAIMTVVATNGTDRWNTQTVALVVNIMDLQVTPTNLTNTVWRGETPTSQTFAVRNAGSGSFTYTAQTGASWIACSPTSGTVGASSSDTLTLSYASTAGWAMGTSNTTVTIASSDGGGTSRTVSVTLKLSNDVQSVMSVSPTLLSNVVWVGAQPTSRTFEVRNSAGISFNYTTAITSTCDWITSVTPASDTVAANSTNLLTVAYKITTGWAVGDSNASINVISSNGNGATQTVNVALNVQNIASVMDVLPTVLTNGVTVDATPPGSTFNILNLSDVSFDFTLAVTTGAAWITSAPLSGTVAAQSSTAVTQTYAAATGWQPGTESNGLITVTTIDGGGASKDVAVKIYIYRSGITNTIPFYDDFEQYTNLTPLVGGINGWYGSSPGIMVQQNVKSNGLQAAMIPVDCVLSNPFAVGSPFNVRMEMDMRLIRFNGSETNFPAVDTNAVSIFYVDTNGHFVVCNGTSTWCVVSNAVGSGSEYVVTNDTWTHISIYLDYRYRHWKLKANNVLITNKIWFITQQTNNFNGFEIYNSTATSYLDNVSVNWWDRFKINGVLDHEIRSVNGVIPDSIMGVSTP